MYKFWVTINLDLHNLINFGMPLIWTFIIFLGFDSDMEQMKERFAKLLLGEDMSGGGKGVSSALALSNAITNLAGMFTSSPLYNVKYY